MKIRAVTAFWGADFVQMFLSVGLRSLFADGNLPDLARRHQVTFSIYTTPADAERLEATPEITRLRELLDVRITVLGMGEIQSKYHGSHSHVWQLGLDVARRKGELLFLIIPDILYATGTMMAWADRFERGAKALYTPGPQVVMETILPELDRRFPATAGPISIAPDQVAQLLMQH